MRRKALLAAAGLLLGACATESAVSSPQTSPSASETESSSGSSSSTPSSSGLETPPQPTPQPSVQPGTAAPGSVAALETMDPSEVGAALVAVDVSTGTVSWYDGFVWQAFDVDAALAPSGWATDGEGGLFLQDETQNIWHLEPFSDEPTLLLEGPPPDANIGSRLVGGGLLDGRRNAYVEQGTHVNPESATADLLAFDLDGRADRTLFTDVAGWESGIGEVHIAEGAAVITFFAECQGSVFVRDLDTAEARSVARGTECTDIRSTVGRSAFGEAAALAIVASLDEDLPWTLAVRSLGDFEETEVSSLPMHTDRWLRISAVESRALVSANGIAIFRDLFGTWRRITLDVPGVVVAADGLAIG
jgi:hypothetical protein